jgi:hypothetical protein
MTIQTDSEIKQMASEIQQKIAMLTEFSGENLKGEMQSLKKALNENPAACSLLLDEDIGMAVAALRRMVGIAVTAANAPKEKKEKKGSTRLTAAELAAQLSLIDDSEL